MILSRFMQELSEVYHVAAKKCADLLKWHIRFGTIVTDSKSIAHVDSMICLESWII